MIDLVIPYVDSSDPQWIELYNKCNKNPKDAEINGSSRFRGQGNFFKYMFRCIAKNMPWIHNIFLLVQSKSQIPSWLNTDRVKVITHDQFMPKEFLPTFNSTAIEMFIWNIPDLSETFLYTNDDIWPVGKMEPSFFFEGNQCKTNGRLCYNINNTMYGNHIVNSWELIYEKKNTYGNCCFGFSHLIRPLLKSKCKECYEKYKDKIHKSITQFRDVKNFNVYIYDNYIIRHTKTLPRIDLKQRTVKSELNEMQMSRQLQNIGKDFNILNICDSKDDIDIYNSYSLMSTFAKNYPSKCIYEK